MATNVGETSTDYITGRLAEMEKENAQLKRELQALRAERDVARGAAQSAMAERVAAQDLTGRLVAEEHATQQVLAEQSSNFTYVNVMLLLTFATSLITLLAMLIWLPNRVVNDLPPRAVAAPAPPAAVSTPYARVR